MSVVNIVSVTTMALSNSNVLLVMKLLILCANVNCKVYQNFSELTKLNGYKSEEHTVVTDDGYLLTIFRISEGAKCNEEKKKTPVLFMPPLLASSDTAVEAGTDASLPYLLSDECFDTWLGNPRGSYYGRRHISLDPDKDKEFWDFCVDEIGTYDAPAIVNYVLNNTKADKLIYIGFSQGGGSFFIMCSERPGFCDKIKLMVGLSPGTRHLHTKSWLLRLSLKNIARNLNVFEKMGVWEVFGRDRVVETMKMICREFTAVCEFFMNLVDSSHPGSVAKPTLRKLLDHFPAGTSVKNIVSYSQSVQSPKFTKFDYGKKKNKLKYGQTTPPEFNLTAANVPVLLITGQNDGINDVKDVKWLASHLPNLIKITVVEDPLWNHIDMFFSQFVNKMLFPNIKKYLLVYDEL